MIDCRALSLTDLDFGEKGDLQEIRGTFPGQDLIGITDTVGQSAVNKAMTVYKGMGIKERATMRGMLRVDEAGAIEVTAESYAQDLAKDLHGAHSSRIERSSR